MIANVTVDQSRVAEHILFHWFFFGISIPRQFIHELERVRIAQARSYSGILILVIRSNDRIVNIV